MSKIRFIFNTGDQLTATLGSNSAALDFVTLLPLSLKLDDYHNIEKVSNLPKRLSTKGEPKGYQPSKGDITYYAPWGNLAIFYRDFGFASGLIRLGQFDNDISLIKTLKAPLSVTIDVV